MVSRTKFEAMLRAYQTGRNDKASAGSSTGRLKTRGGVEAAFARCGAVLERGPASVIGYSARAIIFGNSKATHTNASQDEIAAMHTELANMKQMVVLSMLQQQSASERLQGVSFQPAGGTNSIRK